MPVLPLKASLHSLLASALLLLSGCGVFDRDELFLRPSQYEARTAFVPMPVERAWVTAPGLRALYQRPVFEGYEQRLSLANPTVLPGDNLMVLRVRDNIVPEARLVFEEFTRWTGGLPAPFEGLTAGELMRGEDEMGPYFYAEHRSGPDTVCVFGLRRLNGSHREIPAQGDVMDVQLRNCLRGSPEEALAPLLAASLRSAPGAAQPDGTSRLLSPLAGPGL